MSTEQKAEATKRFPNAMQFWRPLVPNENTDPVTHCIVWPPAKPVE
jgi:hypothetical protein